MVFSCGCAAFALTACGGSGPTAAAPAPTRFVAVSLPSDPASSAPTTTTRVANEVQGLESLATIAPVDLALVDSALVDSSDTAETDSSDTAETVGEGGSPATTPVSRPVPARPVPAFVRLAAARAVAAKTGRIELRVRIAGIGSNGAELVLQGSFDESIHRSRLEMDISQFMADAMGLTPDQLAQASLPHSSNFQVVVDGDVQYLQLGALVPDFEATGVQAAKPWLRMPVPAQSNNVEVQQSLGQLLQPLDARATSFVELGQDEIRGRQLRHVRVLVPLNGLTSIVDQNGSLVDGGVPSAVTQSGLTNWPMDIWLDDLGQVARVSTTFDPKELGAPFSDLSIEQLSRPVVLGITMDLFDLGRPVSIEVPPPELVSAASPTMAQLFG